MGEGGGGAHGVASSSAKLRASAAGKNIDVYNSIGHHGNAGGTGGRPRWTRGWCCFLAGGWVGERVRRWGGCVGEWVASLMGGGWWCGDDGGGRVNRRRRPPLLLVSVAARAVGNYSTGGAANLSDIVLYLLIRLAVASSRTRSTAVARNSHALTPPLQPSYLFIYYYFFPPDRDTVPKSCDRFE